jgi:hypothetical protein
MVTHTFSPDEDNRMLGVLKDRGTDETVRQTWEGPHPTGESCFTRFSVMIRREKVRKDRWEGLHLTTGGQRHQWWDRDLLSTSLIVGKLGTGMRCWKLNSTSNGRYWCVRHKGK